MTQFDELDFLGYQGFAFAYKGEDMLLVGTADSRRVITQDILEYLHAVFITGQSGNAESGLG